MRATSTLFHPLTLLTRAYAGVVALKTAWDRRRLVGQMAGFDDHMLRDIGLSRSDIMSALADPMMSDPTCRLALRAHEFRSNQRASALEQRRWADLMGSDADIVTPPRTRRAA